MTEPRPRRALQRYFFSAPARRVWAVAMGLLVLFTLYVALTPNPPEDLSLGWDKLNHTTTFGMLAFVGVFALHGVARANRLLAGGLFALGVVIELVQLLVPGRRGDWQDLLADTLGIAVGLAIGALVAHAFERRRVGRQRTGAAQDVHSSRR